MTNGFVSVPFASSAPTTAVAAARSEAVTLVVETVVCVASNDMTAGIAAAARPIASSTPKNRCTLRAGASSIESRLFA